MTKQDQIEKLKDDVFELRQELLVDNRCLSAALDLNRELKEAEESSPTPKPKSFKNRKGKKRKGPTQSKKKHKKSEVYGEYDYNLLLVDVCKYLLYDQ